MKKNKRDAALENAIKQWHRWEREAKRLRVVVDQMRSKQGVSGAFVTVEWDFTPKSLLCGVVATGPTKLEHQFSLEMCTRVAREVNVIVETMLGHGLVMKTTRMEQGVNEPVVNRVDLPVKECKQ